MLNNTRWFWASLKSFFNLSILLLFNSQIFDVKILLYLVTSLVETTNSGHIGKGSWLIVKVK